MQQVWQKILAFFTAQGEQAAKKRANLLVIFALAGIVLLGLSYIWEQEPPEPSARQSGTAEAGRELEQQLEQRLTQVVQRIAGAGQAYVMVTLDSTAQAVYAQDISRQEEGSGGEGEQYRQSSQSTHILYDGGSGEQPLVERQIAPKVRGVVVLCQGAQDPVVEAQVTQAVATSLGISSSRICVAKLSN